MTNPFHNSEASIMSGEAPRDPRAEGSQSGPTGHRRARAGSVAVGYLGASWLALQVLDVIRDILPVPSWLAPGLLIVLALGFVFVVATAWIQANPDTTRRENAGELPGDWQIAPREAFGALRRGRFPHLTWGRTLLGGVFALSLLFGAAGFYVVVSNRLARGGSGGGGPSIATMPFTTSGEGLDVYREGMVELLATNLDGLGDIRAIASRTVLARWDEMETESRPDLDQVLRTARATGASHAIVGSIVARGGDVRFTSHLYDLNSAVELPIAEVQGPASEFLSLVDRLSIAVARALLGSEGGIAETDSRLASLTTSSVPALRLYLQAEALYRRGAFEEALPFLDRAVEADPSFGVAVMRRAQVFGWLPQTVPPDTVLQARRAIEPLLSGMSNRDATLARAGIVDFAKRDPTGVRLLREFVVRYPDDAEGWFQLSDFLYHLNSIRGGERSEVLGGFERAAQLAPGFAPYYIHATDAAFIRGDSATARDLLARYHALAGEDDRWRSATLIYRALFESASLAPGDSLIAETLTRSTRLLHLYNAPDAIATLAQRYFEPTDIRRVSTLLRAGRWSEARQASTALRAEARDSVLLLAIKWAGAFGLDRSAVALMVTGAGAPAGEGFWVTEPAATLDRMLEARDKGVGADPVLLASTAVRAGKTALADSLLREESWREYGPAMTYRLAKLYESTGRQQEALKAYQQFLDFWRNADTDLPPVRDAKDKLARRQIARR
ncbi:MAG: hypothetical protein ABIV28_07440 [Longimicrobiales bacterium]